MGKNDQTSRIKTATATSFKSRLSEYLKMVEQGQVLLIADHDRPIAEVHKPLAATQNSNRQHLYRRGVLRTPAKSLDLGVLDGYSLVQGSSGLTKAVLEERKGR